MKLWLVRYIGFGFPLCALVVEWSDGAAVARLKLGPDFKFCSADELGVATDQTQRVVFQERL